MSTQFQVIIIIIIIIIRLAAGGVRGKGQCGTRSAIEGHSRRKTARSYPTGKRKGVEHRMCAYVKVDMQFLCGTIDGNR